MTEPTIVCPNCATTIRLTESLAAPLIAATRQDFERRILEKDETIAAREQAFREQEQSIAEARRTIDSRITEGVAAQLSAERTRLVAEEARKARLELGAEIDAKSSELSELKALLLKRDSKLAEAQAEQANLIRKQRELDDAHRELALTVQKKVSAELAGVRAQAMKEVEDSIRLKVADKDKVITSMQEKIEDLKRKADQGSQQLQGEVQELELENLLRGKFPFDSIEPVPKGEFGGDVVHRVIGPGGQACGTILWESKRTKHWSDTWLAKLRDDQRAAKAEIAILVSQVLPKGVETFDVIDGVWITTPRAALPVATSLRHGLMQVSMARQVAEGQQTKTEMVYQYLTGPAFRHRVEAIVETFTSMREDLDRERKVISKQWAKREQQIARVVTATVGMYGDLQGIAGKSMQEIEGLEFEALSSEPERPKDGV
jgi:hypothetical protein